MPISQLNHAVLYVADLDRSREFYCSVLEFRVRHAMAGAAFLQASG
ncbi:MAG: VOC family protein, partial [Angustibacter sp.]